MDETDSRQSGDSRRLSVKEAAETLGTTPDGIRARIRRGTLTGEKIGPEWVVILPATDGETVAQQSGTVGDSRATVGRVAELEATISKLEADKEFLQDIIRAHSEAERELRVLLSQAQQKIPELTAGNSAESRARPEAFASTPASDTSHSGESITARSWWRRLLGLG